MKRRLLIAGAVVLLALALSAGLVASSDASSDHVLNVDGTDYAPTKVVGSGPTVHYETPDTNPAAAFSERHVWTGNGSENLPCEFGLHWIDNANVLTISNCLEGRTTTTTTEPEVTTTTEPEVTTTIPDVTTTVPEDTTTTVPDTTTSTSIPTDIPSGAGLPPSDFDALAWGISGAAAIGAALLGWLAFRAREPRIS